MDIKEAMKLRASCRDYQPQQITDAQLDAVLEAAYLAPTAMGKYEDVQLIVVQDQEKLDRLNALSAEVTGDAAMKPTYGAPTLIYVCTKAETEDLLAGANVGCIMENMLVAAAAEGLGSVYLYGICRMLEGSREAASIIGIPDGFRAISAAAIGVPAQTPVSRTADSSKIRTVR